MKHVVYRPDCFNVLHNIAEIHIITQGGVLETDQRGDHGKVVFYAMVQLRHERVFLVESLAESPLRFNTLADVVEHEDIAHIITQAVKTLHAHESMYVAAVLATQTELPLQPLSALLHARSCLGR